jgi:hypothetical protein
LPRVKEIASERRMWLGKLKSNRNRAAGDDRLSYVNHPGTSSDFHGKMRVIARHVRYVKG